MTAAALTPGLASARVGPERFVGVTVLPEYYQSEGVDRVLDNLKRRVGVSAVATAPYVMAPSDESHGQREPPGDAGAGSVRLLDRALWGKRELYVTTAPSWVPDLRLYKGLLHQPAVPNELTRTEGRKVKEFLRGARAQGLKVYFQIEAASPPGYRWQFGGLRPESQPRLPDGRIPPRRLDSNGSLASPHIRRYTEALIRDLCREYPEIDGIRMDWPEYPPYFLDDVFLDFSDAAKEAANRLGFSFERMRRDAGQLYTLLHGKLTDQHLSGLLDRDGGLYAIVDSLNARPGLLELMRFKAVLVDELLAGFRKTLTEAGGREKELIPHAFPPPFSLVSGMDYRLAAKHADAIGVKLFTMHWPVMVRFYGDVLKQANPSVSEKLLVNTLVRCMDIADDGGFDRLADYTYPGPETPHPVGLKAQARKIRQARAAVPQTPIIALAHGYGPLHDYRARLKAAYEAADKRVWVNRYGYLSDEKLDATGEVCRA